MGRNSNRSSVDASNAGDLFICFSSRPSTTRRPSTKPFFSPARPSAIAAPSLSSSLSRRLHSSGSLKGGHSPAFPSSGRRKGPAFDAVEPSSPKVTCIGQVRVKSKKKKKAAARAKGAAFRSRSMRGSRGEVSSRRAEEERSHLSCAKSQKWVHSVPVSICEALRGLGSEFSCFFPCGGRSICGSGGSSRLEDRGGERRGCAAALARWLMAVQDSEDVKGESLSSLVIDNGDDDDDVVFVDREREEMEIVINERMKREAMEAEETVMVKNEEAKDVEEGARVSVCVPPPNALLLMRCRSDPIRMAALATRFWDSPAMNGRVLEEVAMVEDEEDEQNDNATDEMTTEYVMARVEAENEDEVTRELMDQPDSEIQEGYEVLEALIGEIERLSVELEQSVAEESDDEVVDVKECDFNDPAQVLRMSVTDELEEDREIIGDVLDNVQLKQKPKEIRNDINLLGRRGEVKEEMEIRRSSSCSEGRRSFKWQTKVRESGRRRSLSSKDKDIRRHSFSVEMGTRRSSFSSEKEARRLSFCNEGSRRWSFCIEKEEVILEIAVKEKVKKFKEEHGVTTDKKAAELDIEVHTLKTDEKETEVLVNRDRNEELMNYEKENRITKSQASGGREEKSGGLPDCLLLMMYEPKLSMEVSKETWVCSTDFVRWRPHHSQYRPCQPSAISKVGEQGGTNDSVKCHGETDVKIVEGWKDKSNENKRINLPVASVPKPLMTAPQPVLTSAAAEKKSKGNAAMVLAPVPPYAPFALTRCKSEPMRSSARLIAEACFWKDRHRPLNAAGIGF